MSVAEAERERIAKMYCDRYSDIRVNAEWAEQEEIVRMQLYIELAKELRNMTDESIETIDVPDEDGAP